MVCQRVCVCIPSFPLSSSPSLSIYIHVCICVYIDRCVCVFLYMAFYKCYCVILFGNLTFLLRVCLKYLSSLNSFSNLTFSNHLLFYLDILCVITLSAFLDPEVLSDITSGIQKKKKKKSWVYCLSSSLSTCHVLSNITQSRGQKRSKFGEYSPSSPWKLVWRDQGGLRMRLNTLKHPLSDPRAQSPRPVLADR